jgi:hypothetical protein
LAVDAAWDMLREVMGPSRRLRLTRLAAWTMGVVVLLMAVVPALGRYTDLDASHDTRGRAVLEATFDALPADAVVLSWWSYSTNLWYGRWVEGRRPDITILDDRDILDDGFGRVEAAIDHYLGERPVYLIRLERDLAALEARYELERVPDMPLDLRRVVARKAE